MLDILRGLMLLHITNVLLQITLGSETAPGHIGFSDKSLVRLGRGDRMGS